MRTNFKIIILILLTITFTGCVEKITYSGKMFNLNDDIYNFNTKNEIIDNLGHPNYIDPIEKKYFYYSEKIISKNFFDKKIVDSKIIVIHFNSNDTIKSIDEYFLDNQNKIKIVEDQTSNEIFSQGLLEKIFGGVGTTTAPTSP